MCNHSAISQFLRYAPVFPSLQRIVTNHREEIAKWVFWCSGNRMGIAGMAALSVNLLGPFQVQLDGETVDGFGYDKVRALLAYLAYEGDRPQRRETLGALLWGEQTEKAARDSLRQALARLRKAIGDTHSDAPLLLVNREAVQINPAAGLALDVHTFQTLLATCQHHRHRHIERCSACAARLTEANALYRGELLAGFAAGGSVLFEEWLLAEREMLHRQALGALFTLAAYHERRGDYGVAYQYAARQIALEPWREEAQRQAMRALALQGQRSAALAQYERCKGILATELDLQPAPQTRTLAEQIRTGVLVEHVDKPFKGTVPVGPTALVGRDESLSYLSQRLVDPDCRLLTVSGPGGAGKTRLVQALAAQMEMTFADGVGYIALAPVKNGDEAIRAIAEVLQLRLAGPSSEAEQLLTFLADKELLLVLDNYEQLLPDVRFLQRLPQRAPDVVALVSSRHRLGLSHEWSFDLEGLAYPDSYARPVEEYSAVQLFVQRAKQADSGFVLDETDKAAIAHICRLVEGLPLAIELAAAATRYYSCAQIAGRIEEKRQILVSGASDVPERQRSITATFDYSWELLPEQEQAVLATLSVFHGGFDEAAAGAVAGATAPQLWSLADKSLLRRAGSGRYDMHELLRQFAADKRAYLDNEDAGKRRHLEFFAALAEEGEQQLRGADDLAWLQRLEWEQPNFGAALAWGVVHDVATAARLANANWLFWFMHTHLVEGKQWYERLLGEEGVGLSPALRARALTGYASMSMGLDDHEGAKWASEEGLALMRQLGNGEGVSLSLHHLSYAASARGDRAEGLRLREEALELSRDLPHPWLVSIHLHTLAIDKRAQGLLDEAEDLLDEDASLITAGETAWSALYRRCLLAEFKLQRGALAVARQLFFDTLAPSKAYGDRRLLSWAYDGLGRVALQDGEWVEADAYLARALQLERELGREGNGADLLLLRGDVAARRGYFEQALDLYGESEQLYRATGNEAGITRALEKAGALKDLRAGSVSV